MIRFYNTISRKKEEFIPIVDGAVKLYTCGPTVYDYAHIGNFRAYIFEDLLRRFLEYKSYKVNHIMNITDIDDKTIKNSIKQNKKLTEFTSYYTSSFFDDVRALNILPAHHYPKATDFVTQMIGMIESLESEGFTYSTNDGSVFFKISKFKNYGHLSNLNPDNLKKGERVLNDEYEKEEMRDFALWKGYKKADGDVFWDSPWGKGRPGWHIECSAMSMHYLGSHFDIHCGGVDNIFPHHENEIAQSVCSSGDKFVNYWIHNEHLLVDGQKMSKSEGNFYTIRDLLNKNFSPESIRYTLLTTHYRQKLNFTLEKLEASQKAINRLRELKRRLLEVGLKKSIDNSFISDSKKMLNEFAVCLGDDLNISGAMGALFKWVSKLFVEMDHSKLSRSDARDAVNHLSRLDKILGVIDGDDSGLDSNKIDEMIEKRRLAREQKNWEMADKIRIELESEGIILEDTSSGTVWKRK